MMNFDSFPSSFKSKKGFTVIELIIVIALFGFISAILMTSLLSVYRFKEVVQDKKQLNFEASSILNNGIPALIRSGFAINYDLTQADHIQKISEGMQKEVDQISIFTDRAETQYFTLYRKPYKSQGDQSDTAPLYIKFSNGEEFPLHSSEVVVEAFDVKVPADPRLTGDSDLQPYVTLYLRLRNRYPFGEIRDENELKAHETIRASYSTTIAFRNAGPASYKNAPVSNGSFSITP